MCCISCIEARMRRLFRVFQNYTEEIPDLTSNLDVALFFATCKYDKKTDTYDYYHDKGEHEGVLYVFDPIRD